ncbi:unnamed protein product [Brassica napus]|uniref:(rape) hypothetical protein n=1 Tax=Brassica napus TaxID=3708 RepID=A0A816WEH4_BRANA|nr:unnamed protein product [Brassica napus]
MCFRDGEARKALESALGGKKNEFDKWDKEIKKREESVMTEMVAREEEEAGLEAAAAGSVVIISGMKHNRSPLLS